MTTPQEPEAGLEADPGATSPSAGSADSTGDSRVDDTVERADDGSGVAAVGGATRRSLLWLTLTVAAIVIAIDQVTKYWAVEYLQGRAPIEVLGEWLQLRFVRNTGAAFSLGAGYTIIFSAIALVVIVVILRTASRLGSRAWAVALGGLLGGALGNLIDRLHRDPGFGRGFVVDFIELPNWPVFNCADMAIVGGAVLMAYLAVRGVEMSGRRG